MTYNSAELGPPQKDQTSTTEEEDEGGCGMLEAQVLSLSRMVRENSAEFIKDMYGSHVARTLIHVLGGCLGPARTETRPGTESRTHSGRRLHAYNCYLNIPSYVGFCLCFRCEGKEFCCSTDRL